MTVLKKKSLIGLKLDLITKLAAYFKTLETLVETNSSLRELIQNSRLRKNLSNSLRYSIRHNIEESIGRPLAEILRAGDGAGF